MSHDLILKHSLRNWSRHAKPASEISGTATKSIALGTMALGTLAGLFFITSPWWRPLPAPPAPARKRMYLKTGTPYGRVSWSNK